MTSQEYQELVNKHNAGQRKPQKHEEDDIQEAFLCTARIMFPELGKLLYHCCNEGKRNPKRAKKVGIIAGVPDIHVAVSNGKYHSLYIEFKAGSNKQTADQIEFQKQAESANNMYCLCYSAKEGIDALNDYFKNIRL